MKKLFFLIILVLLFSCDSLNIIQGTYDVAESAYALGFQEGALFILANPEYTDIKTICKFAKISASRRIKEMREGRD